jgi:hypothetical protein
MNTRLLLRAWFAASILIAVGRVAAAQDPATFERVLVPVSVSNVPGAYGTLWSTELWYRNNSDRPVAVWPLAISDPVPTIRITTRLPIGVMPASAPGQLLFVSRDGGDQVQFDLRLFNRSDPAATWGTKLPVVREREFTDALNLINVPTAQEFRSTLRIYALPETVADGETVHVRVYSHDERLLADAGVALHGYPRYGMIGSLTEAFPQIRTAERVRVEVEAQSVSSAIWAFVSVTSNATQQVSIVTPE